jgi:tetratricopeptide (TPR) repeat protein
MKANQHKVMAEGVRLIEKALELARRLDDPEALWFAAAGSYLFYAAAPRHAEKRRRIAEELAARSRAGVTATTLSLSLAFVGAALLESGQRDHAEKCFAEARTIGERSRQANVQLLSMIGDGLLATLDGRLDDAVEVGRQVEGVAREMGFPTYGLIIETISTVTALIHTGRFDEIAQLYDLTRYPLSGLLLKSLHREAEATAFLDLLVSTRSRLEPLEDETWVSLDISSLQAALMVGHRPAVEFLLHRLAEVGLHTTNFMGGLTCPARHLGAAAAFLGRPDEARAYYGQAMELATKLRFRPEIALIRLQLAELLLDHYPAERPAAMEHLDFAVTEFREMKMQPSLERALRHKEILKA